MNFYEELQAPVVCEARFHFLPYIEQLTAFGGWCRQCKSVFRFKRSPFPGSEPYPKWFCHAVDYTEAHRLTSREVERKRKAMLVARRARA